MESSAVAEQRNRLPPLRNTRGDLSIKGSEGEPWVRLDSPTGDKRHNCYRVIFDGGITVVQENKSTKGICTVKFLVDSPLITFDTARQRGGWAVEAKCLEIEGPEFDSKDIGDKAAGIENARAFAVAHLSQPIGFVKLENMTTGDFNRRGISHDKLVDEMKKSMMGNTRATAATDAGKGRQQEILRARMAQLKTESDEAVSRKLAELAEKREAAIAMINAGHDRMVEEEAHRLREIQALEKEKIQRALDSL